MSWHSLVVNALTLSRLPLVFVWLALAVAAQLASEHLVLSSSLAAVAVFILFIVSATDAIDGNMARRWNVVTKFGKMVDPLMDKMVYVVVFPALIWLIHEGRLAPRAHSLIMTVFTILYILRDLWVTFIRSVGALYGAEVGAMTLGKVRTALSFPVALFIYTFIAATPFLSGFWAGLWLKTCYAMELFMILLNFVSFAVYTKTYTPYLKKALDKSQEI